MTNEEAIAALNANKLMHSYEEAMAFEEALAELAKQPKNEYLRSLHLVLDDRCWQHEVMYGLVHFLDYFALEERLQAFIDVTPQMAIAAPEWMEILVYRILNNDSARELFKQFLSTATTESQDALLTLLKDIATNESPPLSSRAQFVILEGAGIM